MNFEKNWSTLFEDINIPELFVSNHLTNANGDYVKLYLYCMSSKIAYNCSYYEIKY